MTKEKKEKENVLTNLELANLKSNYLFNFEELRKRTQKKDTEVEKEKLMEANKKYQRNLQ